MGSNTGQRFSHNVEGGLWECSPHPGGELLTERLADMVGIGERCVVLDATAGRGESAFYLAETYGCRVVAMDLSLRMAGYARDRLRASSVVQLLSFAVGDAVELPFCAGSFDIIFCECSFSLLDRKHAAAGEFHRVLRRGGRMGIADFYVRAPVTASRLHLCPSGTETEETYRAIMRENGFHEIRFQDETQKLKEHFVDLLFSSDCMGSLLDKLPGRAERTAHFKSVGYCIMTATKM